jgi:hypothetical protein
MAKQSRKKSRRQRHRRYKKQTRKMSGGEFTENDKNTLMQLGFNNNDIEILTNAGVGLNAIRTSLNEINPNTGNLFTPKELIDSINEANNEINNMDISVISNASDDEHNLDDSLMNNNVSFMNNEDSLNTTRDSNSNLNDSLMFDDDNFNSNDSLHLSDLDGSNQNSSVNTTIENSFGGKKRKTMKKRKGRKSSRKGRKSSRKSRKQKGGICYGNGIGANHYDPNFSIYNTRELQLFPYKP